AKMVVNLGEPLKALQDTPSATYAEVRNAFTIAEACFGNCWIVLVAAMILALKHR
ncbi:hypothetical protein K469DRAFT_585562, partial [Zopfia rhizophila CBS 207.26]